MDFQDNLSTHWKLPIKKMTSLHHTLNKEIIFSTPVLLFGTQLSLIIIIDPKGRDKVAVVVVDVRKTSLSPLFAHHLFEEFPHRRGKFRLRRSRGKARCSPTACDD